MIQWLNKHEGSIKILFYLFKIDKKVNILTNLQNSPKLLTKHLGMNINGWFHGIIYN